MMTSKDAYDIALNIADKAMGHLKFFVVICTAFGGWMFAGTDINGLDQMYSRVVLALIFTISTSGLLVGTTDAMGRLNAALDVSRALFEKENNGLSEAAKRLHAHGSINRNRFAMGGTIALVDAIILFH